MILQEALSLGMFASAQVQFANLQSQYPLESSSDSDEPEDGHTREDNAEAAQGVADDDDDDDDDEDVDDTFDFIKQRRTAEEDDSETTAEDVPSKRQKTEKRSKKRNDSH
ncbi:hypothetical protein ACH5RR_013335 [Cinchona calisaya]|uniref:Uncharacterized protein n=1 Tax=Cinchona calisaya TaxID=153742 RepID=A0ABD3A142_9GENT